MRDKRAFVLVAGLAMIAAACSSSGDAGLSAAAPSAPTTTFVAPPTTLAQVAALSEPMSAPEVQLLSGEVVPLFESFDRTSFTRPTDIDNPWLPMRPGDRYVYEGFTEEEGERLPHRLVFTVTDLVKVIDGVPSVVIWDVDYSDGDLVETELAFFAQDDSGNVWRMGEYPEEWEEGEFIAAPAWIAGIDDARAGIAMKGRPLENTPSYSQGWGPAVEFTDRGFVLNTNSVTCVSWDCYTNVLIVQEFNEEEPGLAQLKLYAAGVGNVEVGWTGDDSDIEELELVDVIRLTDEEMDQVRRSALRLEERAYILNEGVYGLTERITGFMMEDATADAQ